MYDGVVTPIELTRIAEDMAQLAQSARLFALRFSAILHGVALEA